MARGAGPFLYFRSQGHSQPASAEGNDQTHNVLETGSDQSSAGPQRLLSHSPVSPVQVHCTLSAPAKAEQFEVEVPQPLGIQLEAIPGTMAGVKISEVRPGSNAERAGLQVGDQIVFTSSFFGDELWPSKGLDGVKTAIKARRDSVYFAIARDGYVDVRKLSSKRMPPLALRTVPEEQRSQATHICTDCSFVYALDTPFEEQGEDYQCPQCKAPKPKFALYDAKSGFVTSADETPLNAILSLWAGLVILGLVAVLGISAM